MVNGQLLQMNKPYSQLKNKQKEKISNWMYEAYKKQERENHLVQKQLALLPNICEASSRDSCRSLLRYLIKGLPHHFSHRHSLLLYPAFLKSLPDIMFVCLYIIIQRADSLEKALMLGKFEGKRRGRQRMRWLVR